MFKQLLGVLFLVLLMCGSAFGANYDVATGVQTVDGDTFCGGSACDKNDTITITGGARGSLTFQDFDGVDGYITIQNEDTDRVIITHDERIAFGVLNLRNCKYVDLKGDNNVGFTYGIKVISDGTPDTPSGTVWVNGESDHIKLSYLEVDMTGEITGTGIMVQDSGLTDSWIFDTFEIHNNYVHDTGYAGMYLGHNEPYDDDNPYVANFLVHDNTLEDLGSYGIKLAGGHADGGVSEIYNNAITTTGLVFAEGNEFKAGIRGCTSWSGSYVKVYGNTTTDTAGAGIQITSSTTTPAEVYGNTIINPGTDNGDTYCNGITVFHSYSPIAPRANIHGNTITTPHRDGVRIAGNAGPCDIYNNLILGAGEGGTTGHGVHARVWSSGSTTTRYNTIIESLDKSIYYAPLATGTVQDNLMLEEGTASTYGSTGDSAPEVGVTDADADNMNFETWSDDQDYTNDDYNLTDTTPATVVDAGQETGVPSSDFAGTVKPQGEGADLGAYEYIPVQDPPPGAGGWRYCALVIQEGQVPDGEDHTNFPVLLDKTTLPAEMIDSDLVCAGGTVDFAFFSDSGLTAQLDHQKVLCTCNADPAAAVVEIWVEVGTVNDDADTTIYVKYKNQAYGTDYGDYGDPWSGHEAVWHFEEADAGGGTVYYDATANSNDGTLVDADDDSTRETGQIGAAIGFNGDADFVGCGNGASLEMGLKDWTISCWALMAAGDNRFVEKGANGPTVEGYDFYYSGANDEMFGRLSDGATRLGIDSDNTLALDDSAWRFIAVVHDRSGNATFYSDSGGSFAADGTFDISSFVAKDITNSGKNLRIGSGGDGSRFSVTQIDELRVADTLRSANWLTTCYNNQKTPSTFVVEGAPDDVSADATRATVLALGWWDASTDTCVLDKSITYTATTDIIPLCVKCSEQLSVEVPGTVAGPPITVDLDYGSNIVATYNGYYNDGTYGYLKFNCALSTVGERQDDLIALAVSSLDLGLSTAIDAFSITAADPAVVTTGAAHGLKVGDFIFFKAVGEMTEILYQVHEITVVADTTHFTLGGLDASGYAAEDDDGDEEYQSTAVYVVDPSTNMLDPDLTAATTDFSTSAIVVAIPGTFTVTSVNTPGTYDHWVPGDDLTLITTTDEAIDTAVSGTAALPITLHIKTPIVTALTDNWTIDEDYWNIYGHRRPYNGTMTDTGTGNTVTGFSRASTGTGPAGFNTWMPHLLFLED